MYKIFMKLVPVISEVLVQLTNIESPVMDWFIHTYEGDNRL